MQTVSSGGCGDEAAVLSQGRKKNEQSVAAACGDGIRRWTTTRKKEVIYGAQERKKERDVEAVFALL